MIRILLYDCGLQLLSSLDNSILQHPAITTDIKRRHRQPSSILLDLSIHQSAFPKEKGQYFGRPEIVHQSILEFLYSPILLRWGSNIEFFIHTVENKYFKVPSTWNPPINYYRFRGLMEQLLNKHSLITNAGQLILHEGTVFDLVKPRRKNTQDYRTVILSSKGIFTTLKDFQKTVESYLYSDTLFTFLIGGYQKGAFPDKYKSLVSDREMICLPGGIMPAWKVIGLIIGSLEYCDRFSDPIKLVKSSKM